MNPDASARLKTNLTIAPLQPDRLQLSSVLLSSQVEAVQNTAQIKTQALGQDAQMKSSPLDVGGERIIPSVTRVFTDQQTLYVFFQAYLPQKAEAASLRAGLVFFRNGQRLSDTPMVAPAEYDEKTHTASFPHQPAARRTQRRALHGASHRGRCGHHLRGVWPELLRGAFRSQAGRFDFLSASTWHLTRRPTRQ